MNLTTLERLTLRVENPFGSNRCSNYNEFFDGLLFFLPTRPRISGFHWSGEQVENMVKDLETKMSKKKITKNKRKVHAQIEDQESSGGKSKKKDETKELDDIINNIDNNNEEEGAPDMEKKLI